jgi:hypothetical protein
MKLKSGKSIGLNIFNEPKPKLLFQEDAKKPSVERDRKNEKLKKKPNVKKIKTIINDLMNEANY